MGELAEVHWTRYVLSCPAKILANDRPQGTLLRNRLHKVVPERTKYQELFDDFKSEVSDELGVDWVTQVVAWEEDNTEPDPYYISPSGELISEDRLPMLTVRRNDRSGRSP